MRVFKHFNSASIPCCICGTHKDKEAVLVEIDDTAEGNIAEAMQVHLDCVTLRVKKQCGDNQSLIYQLFEEKE